MRWRDRERAYALKEQRRIRVARVPAPRGPRTNRGVALLPRQDRDVIRAARAASTNAPRGCSCLNVERADILGRVCAVRSIFLSSRDASPLRTTLNARSMGAREVTGVIPGKIGQSGAEIFTPTGVAKKRFSSVEIRGKLDRRFRISRGFPTTSPACILCGNYPIIGRP